jgi:hypothetical protein
VKLAVAIAIFIFSGVEKVHPLHLSVMEIAHDQKEKELEITLRVFIDDLQSAIRNKLNQEDLDILHPANTTSDKLIWEYLQPHLSVQLDGKRQTIKYLGHEADADALTFYIQVQPVKTWKTIEIKNSILTELFEDQSNLVNITLGEKTKSLRLMQDNPSGKLSFDLN